MKYFLDTHIFIWHAEAIPKLSSGVLAEIEDPKNSIYVSHACFWEITIKVSNRKLDMSIPISELRQLVAKSDFQPQGFNFEHYESLETLPYHHNDPFDRMLIAQAIAEDFTIITQDKQFAAYEPLVKILWN